MFSLLLATLLVAVPALAQSNVAYEVASLREDLRLLQQRVGELGLAVEQLTRENTQLQKQASNNFATVAQLDQTIAQINRTLQAGLADQKNDILRQVAAQIKQLGQQTNAALDALARGQATRPPVQTTFSEDFPKEGINYTIQSGDTLSGIAQKTNSSVQDIVNANKISDPTKIRVGQTLFIPQGK